MVSEDQYTSTIGELIESGVIVAHKDGNHGSNYPRSSEFGDEGVPFLTAKLVSDSGRIDFDNAPRLNLEKANKIKFGYVEEGDVLLSHNATVGRVALVPELREKILIGTSLTHYRLDSRRLLPKYLAAYFRGRDFQNQLSSMMGGMSTRNQVPITAQRLLTVVIPPLEEQKAIAHILGSLDDKIELNRQMNDTLEAMAQALFKSWFVDFDPVIDNALAAGKPIPDELSERAEQRKAMQHGDNQAVRALFPDEFVLTEEMGWIPKGWIVTDVKNSAEKISKGTTPSQAILSKANDENSIPFLKVRDLDDEGKINTQSLDLIPKSIHENALKRSILKKGDLLFSIAGTIGRVSIVPRELDNSNSNQALAFIRPKDITKTYFLLQFLKSEEVQKEINSRIVQAVQANVSLTELGSLKFAQASDELFRKWHSIVQNWIEKISFLQVENSHLTKIRDTLLPKLLSGELRIPDAAALVEDTVFVKLVVHIFKQQHSGILLAQG